jgi:hypothetical protein
MRISLFGGFGLVALAVAAGCAQPPPPEPAAAPAAGPPPAYDIRTLRDLVAICRTAETDPYRASAEGLCWGYASGVLDFYLLDAATAHREARVCLPAAIPRRDEAVASLLAWTDANQQFLDQPAAAGLMQFYVTQYPCAAHGPARRVAPRHR